MMLNNAAALSRSRKSSSSSLSAPTRLLLGGVALLGASALLATSASALPGIDLSSPAEPVGEGACSRLVQIKYPFLSCANGEIGQSSQNETWANSRHLPLQSDWIEGISNWGPTLNPVDYMRDMSDEVE
ncbi:MAG: hypothetical protein AB8G23_24255 [Myxococcota bacterium]